MTEDEVKRRAFRLKIGTDIESLAKVSDQEMNSLAKEVEEMLNEEFGWETPSGVEVTVERLA